MMQHWADYLNELRRGAQILRPNFGLRGTEAWVRQAAGII